jgi:ABC-2 type transport system ATP-binding protein
MIDAKDIYKSFGPVKAVQGVNLLIPAGEIYGLVGSDGAGKTTTLRLLVGALRLDSGQVKICGYSTDKQLEEARSQIGYLSQRFSLYEDLTVLENIRFFAEVRGLSASKWLPRSMEILEFVGLAPFKDRMAGKLSGGMKQKLGLASALVSQPRVLLLDEPTTGVDPVTRQDFWQLLVKLVSQTTNPVAQVAVIITTPYLDEAARCNRIGFMKQGRIIAEGTPSQLRARLNGQILELRGSTLRELGALVANDPGVEDVRLFGDRLHLRTLPGKSTETMSRLERRIQSSGLKLDTIRQVPANLEDVFIILSEQEQQAEKNVFNLPESHANALKILLDLIPPDKYGWTLTGSANLRLQGIELDVHDLDVECNLEDIRKIEKALSGYIKTPLRVWETEKTRSLDGKCEIEGVEIELIAGLEIMNPEGIWMSYKKQSHKTWLEWQGLQVPVIPLYEEAVYYHERGREEKARLIEGRMREMEKNKNA